VLFVNVDYPGDEVLRLAASRGIADVVTETPPPDVAALFSSEPMLLPPLTERDAEREGSYYSSYYNRRKEFFLDKSGVYRLFYIPEKHKKAIPALVGDLRARGVDALWDAPAKQGPRAAQWLLGVGALVLLCEVYLARKIWSRRGWLRYFLRQPYTLPPLVLVILINAIFSLPQALLLIAATAGIARGRLWWEQRQEQRARTFGVFMPRPIRPAVLVALGGRTTKRVVGSAASLCFVLTILAVTSPPGRKTTKGDIKLLSFPAPAGYTNSALTTGTLGVTTANLDSLPDLSHYVQWVYDRMMFPYRSLHDNSFTSDYKAEKGRIIEVTLPEPVLNQEFIDMVLQALDNAPENVMEQVLKKQGGFREILWNKLGE
jgi:hypothetical protein